MKSLKKRVADLERKAGKGKEAIIPIFVDLATDGGMVYQGKFYKDGEALLQAVGTKGVKGSVQFIHFHPTQTAAELLAQAEEAASKRKAWQESAKQETNHPPEEKKKGNAQERTECPPAPTIDIPRSTFLPVSVTPEEVYRRRLESGYYNDI